MFPIAVIRPTKIPAAILIAATFLLLFAGSAFAGDMMSTLCNKHVVSVGNMKGEVLAKCGKPLSKFAGETDDHTSSAEPVGTGKKVKPKKVKRTKGVETWTYNIDGSYRFFIFRGGKLDRIESGGLVH
jgi:hypothetical protein